MSIRLDKIKEFILKNKPLTILVLGILLIVILIVITLLPKKQYVGVALIEQPLYFYKSHKITIPDTVSKSVKNIKQKEIYKINSDNQNIKVEAIITLLNITSPTKNVYALVAYEWKNKDGDTISYDTKTQLLNISLINKKNIFPNIANASDSQLKTLLNDFTHKYVDASFEYQDVNVVKEGLDTKIEGRRLVNGLPLSYPGFEKYHDYILLDQNLNLKSARISMFKPSQEIADKLKIVAPTNLNSAVSSASYPKEINNGLPSGFTTTENNKLIEQGDNFGPILPKSPYTNVSEMELVYFFANVDQQFLTPVYRLTGTGRITYQGKDYDVPTVINASAIDPTKVYIPSNILYAY